MIINADQLENLCMQITERAGLNKTDRHVAALFKDNEHDDIIGWAVLDESNKIVDTFNDADSLEDLINKYIYGKDGK